uniref:Uncharacterized protein n=1 Tax=Calcidiscus leptoporus TaxID=127549 RepID=A0A7S0P2F3_9EUKA
MVTSWSRPGHVLVTSRCGADVNATNDSKRTALCLAAMRGHITIVRVLLDARASLDTEDSSGKSALGWAVARGNNLEVVALLREEAERRALRPPQKAFGPELMLGRLLQMSSGRIDSGTPPSSPRESPLPSLLASTRRPPPPPPALTRR